MGTLTISLPDALKSFVDEQVAKHGYSTSSEYIGTLIRTDQGRAHLRDLLLNGAVSKAADAVDDSYFSSLRSRVRHAESE